jgi:hypothetical protein
MAVIRGARAFRQRPPEPQTPELRIMLGWIEDESLFDWLYTQPILDEYRTVLPGTRRAGLSIYYVRLESALMPQSTDLSRLIQKTILSIIARLPDGQITLSLIT